MRIIETRNINEKNLKRHKFTVETTPQKTHVKSKLKWVHHACQEIPGSSEWWPSCPPEVTLWKWVCPRQLAACKKKIALLSQWLFGQVLRRSRSSYELSWVCAAQLSRIWVSFWCCNSKQTVNWRIFLLTLSCIRLNTWLGFVASGFLSLPRHWAPT